MKTLRYVVTLAVFAFAALLPLVASAGDPTPSPTPATIYGTPGDTTIRVTVSREFEEHGIHYIPIGSKFMELLRSFHERHDIHIDPMHSVQVRRNKKCVSDIYTFREKKDVLEAFQLEDGDDIKIVYFNW